MDNLIQDLESIANGKGSKVRKKGGLRKAWKYRYGEAKVRTERRKIVKTGAAVALLSAMLGAAAMPKFSSWLEKKERERIHAAYMKEYNSSPEGLARAAAMLDPDSVSTFVGSISDKFKLEMQEHYLPVLRSQQSSAVFPEGSYLVTQGVAFQTGRDYASGYFLDMLFSFWKLTGDNQFIDWYVEYAKNVSIDLSGPNMEQYNTVIGRYAYPLEHVPLIKKNATTLSDTDLVVLDELYSQAVTAAALVLDGYHEESGSFPLRETPEWPIGIRLSREEKIMPFVFAIYESPDRDLILSKTRLNINEQHLREILINTGLTTCDRLVDENGKSFSRAYVTKDGKTVNRWPQNMPESLRSEDKQPVVAQDHFALLSAINRRIGIVPRELYPFEVQSLERCSHILTDYAKTTYKDTIPEYLFIPPEFKVHNMEQEGLAEMRRVVGLAVKGKESEFLEELSRVFGTIQLQYTPLNPLEEEARIVMAGLPGLVLGRGYEKEKIGSLNEAEAVLLRSIIHLNYIKEEEDLARSHSH